MSMDSTVGSVYGEHVPNHHKGYQNDILNPYFMHPNENYLFWSCSITVDLRWKNKLNFINGALPCPPDEDHNSICRE